MPRDDNGWIGTPRDDKGCLGMTRDAYVQPEISSKPTK